MIIYLCMKYESNTPMFSKDIARKPFFVRTRRTYVRTDVRTDKGDTICPPIINGGGIKKHAKLPIMQTDKCSIKRPCKYSLQADASLRIHNECKGERITDCMGESSKFPKS